LLMGGLTMAAGGIINAPLSTVASTVMGQSAPLYTAPTAHEGVYKFPLLLTVVWVGMSMGVVAAASLFFGAAGVLALVDALDIGRTPASRQGCCRDEARVQEAAKPGVGKNLAPILAVAGAAAVVLTVFLAIPASTVWASVLATSMPAIIAAQRGTVALPFSQYKMAAAVVLIGGGLTITLGAFVMGMIPVLGAMGLVATRDRDLVDDSAIVETAQEAEARKIRAKGH